MPIPKPKKGESEKAYHSRCMSHATSKKEFPDIAQRNAVCYSEWRNKKK